MNKYRKNQSGLAVVEFVIVLLMLIPMMIGTVELGRYIYQYNTLTKAVRDGARYAGDNALSSSRVLVLSSTLITETQDLVVFGDIGGSGNAVLANFIPSDVSVTPINVSGMSAGTINPNHIRVSANYTFSPIFSLLAGLNITMTASTVQRAI